MSLPWIICLAREDASALAPLRLLAGMEVAEAGPCVWLRGPAERGGVESQPQPRAQFNAPKSSGRFSGGRPRGGRNESLAARLAALSVQARYELLPPNQLRLRHERVPSARLPELRWQPLNLWLQAELPPAALPANNPAPVSLRLVRSTQESQPGLLLTRLAAFREYAVQAARVRLDCLQFAADAAGRLLVRGHPLPSIPGQRFVLHGGVAVPAGFGWEPAVSVAVLARCFGVSGDAIVLWNDDGSITRFHGEQFIPVTRAAVRATESALTGINES
jgi:hypothetical protein